MICYATHNKCKALIYKLSMNSEESTTLKGECNWRQQLLNMALSTQDINEGGS